MHVTAKFGVTSIEDHRAGDTNEIQQRTVHLSAVYGKDGSENAQWSKWTPSGSIQMAITNPAAFEQFNVGAEVYVTFSEKL